MMKQKHIRYSEGQWFAVPLRNGGYALGIIVRGSYKTKGGLGYFFGPKYSEIPTYKSILEKNPDEAILITWFGDFGIINGSWPLIQNSRSFSRAEWSLPKFGRKISLLPDKGYIVEYEENKEGAWKVFREVPVDFQDISGLPEDIMMGGGSVEIKLTKLLS